MIRIAIGALLISLGAASTSEAQITACTPGAAELKATAAVLVVWTPVSVESRWVRGEAREGADRGVLVPVRFIRLWRDSPAARLSPLI